MLVYSLRWIMPGPLAYLVYNCARLNKYGIWSAGVRLPARLRITSRTHVMSSLHADSGFCLRSFSRTDMPYPSPKPKAVRLCPASGHLPNVLDTQKPQIPQKWDLKLS